MKILAWIIGVVISLFTIVYVIAFTEFGNGILQPIVESKIKQQTKMDSKLTKFQLSMSQFEIFLEINKNNTIQIDGNYSLFFQAFSINYAVRLEELESLEPFTKQKLVGNFHTNGNAVGDMKFLTIEGKSDVAFSKTSYHVELTDLNPTSIIAKMNNADLKTLLALGGQKPYASSKIDLDINFKNITPHKLDGDITLKTKDGKINTILMKKDFDIDLPKTNFLMTLDATLKGDDVVYGYAFNSNLANVTSSGKIVPEPLKTDLKYKIAFKELALLQPITGTALRGSFYTKGTLKGSKENMKVEGTSDIAKSKTIYNVTLFDFEPKRIKANIRDMRLQNILYMLQQPHYADGVMDIDIDIKDVRASKLDGIVTSNIKNGLLNSKYLTKIYEFESKMPRTTFNSKATTTLSGDIVDTKLNLNSSLANLSVKKASFNIKESSLITDYLLKVPSLDKFFFVTQRDMKGAITINGELKSAKDLDLTIHSNVVGGKIDAKLHNDDFYADIKGVQTMDVLSMLVYPELLKGTMDAKINYNLAQAKGKITGKLSDAIVMKNQTLDLIKLYAKFDIYKERFNGDVSANINKEKIVASLDLRSNKSAIKTKNTKLNTLKQTIDSRLTIVANKNPIDIKLSGNIMKPKVKVDLQKFMKTEAGDKVKKKVEQKVKEKVDKELNKLFKKLF